MCIFIFRDFQFFRLYSRSFSVHFLFFTLFSDFIIFSSLVDVFIFHDFQFCYIPRPTVDILNFPPFSVFLAYISRPKVYFIFRDFQFSRLYSRSFSVHFLFFTFLVISLFFVASGCFHFPWFSVFFAIFHGPTVDIFKFSTFFSFPRLYISRPKVYFYFPWFSVFRFLYSRSFSVHFYFSRFLVISLFFRRQVDVFIFHDFQFFCYIPRPTVDILNFPPFSVFLALYFTS